MRKKADKIRADTSPQINTVVNWYLINKVITKNLIQLVFSPQKLMTTDIWKTVCPNKKSYDLKVDFISPYTHRGFDPPKNFKICGLSYVGLKSLAFHMNNLLLLWPWKHGHNGHMHEQQNKSNTTWATVPEIFSFS